VDSVECSGLHNFIVPGKSPLPPNFELPAKLQSVAENMDEQNL
jgi:hypothetical protein